MPFDMEAHLKQQRAAKIQRALDALNMTTPGDWWVDSRGDLLNDPVGNFKLGRAVGGGSALWGDSNRTVISAARELAEEVVLLRAELQATRRLHRVHTVQGTELRAIDSAQIAGTVAFTKDDAQLSLLDPLKGGQNG